MTNKPYTISKSEYLTGLYCPKALWLQRNRKDLLGEPDIGSQYRFDVGKDIGEKIKEYLGPGFESKLKHYDIEKAAEETFEKIEKGCKLIYEGTAIHSRSKAYARADVLIGDEDDQWELIEVKSSTGKKPYHIDDLSFQYMVFKNNGLNIKSISVMHLNKTYALEKNIKNISLFKKSDVTKEVTERQIQTEDMSQRIINKCFSKEAPIVEFGLPCKHCEFFEHCWKNIPRYNIYNVFNSSKADRVYKKNQSAKIEDISLEDLPSGKKRVDVNSYLLGKTYTDKVSIRKFVNGLEFPLFFLDFETFSPAIPLFEKANPYNHIPFQFSLHIQRKEVGQLLHNEFLHKERSDPRRNFAETLLKYTESKGSILVYNKNFEMNIIKSLGNIFPDLKSDLLYLNTRMIDLLLPFRSRWLYSPKQEGSSSLKKVLPAFTDQGYSDLNISDGLEASIKYEKFFNNLLDENEIEEFWKNVLEYCRYDTTAMVDVLKILKSY